MTINTLDMLSSWNRGGGTETKKKKELEYDLRLHMVNYLEGKEFSML